MIEVTEINQIINVTVDENTYVVNIDVVEQLQTVNIEVAEIGLQGLKGEKGDDGEQGEQGDKGNDGNTNVFIQEGDPELPQNYVWFEINNEGNLITIWINTI